MEKDLENGWGDRFDQWQKEMCDLPEDKVINFGLWLTQKFPTPSDEKSWNEIIGEWDTEVFIAPEKTDSFGIWVVLNYPLKNEILA